MNNPKLVLLLLRIGIAIVFLYAATASFLQPSHWIGYFPPFLTAMIPGTILLPIFSVYELVLAVWLLTGWQTFYAAVLSALTMVGIIAGNPGALEITFRDIAILFSAAALAVGSYKKK